MTQAVYMLPMQAKGPKFKSPKVMLKKINMSGYHEPVIPALTRRNTETGGSFKFIVQPAEHTSFRFGEKPYPKE